mgnify:CR=1 FL=1
MEQFDLTGQTAVVTGGTRGIGRAIAETLADAGANVVPTSRSEESVEAAAESIRERGVDSLAVPTDVTEEADIEQLFSETVEEFGGVDIVVNNAGVNPDGALGQPEDVDADDFDFVTDVNLRGAFLCAKHSGEHLKASEGSLINVASVGGVVGLPRQHPYVGSKHGLVGITKSMALDWAPDVRVNAIVPGYVSTDLTEDLESNERYRKSIERRTPLERFAEPEELGGPAVFLASDAASYVTGSVLSVDGGWTAR